MRTIMVELIPEEQRNKQAGDQLRTTVRVMSPNGVMYSQAFVPLHRVRDVTITLFSAALDTIGDPYA